MWLFESIVLKTKNCSFKRKSYINIIKIELEKIREYLMCFGGIWERKKFIFFYFLFCFDDLHRKLKFFLKIIEQEEYFLNFPEKFVIFQLNIHKSFQNCCVMPALVFWIVSLSFRALIFFFCCCCCFWYWFQENVAFYFFFLEVLARIFSSRFRCRSVSDLYNL